MVVINIFAIIYAAALFVLYKPLCEFLRVDSSKVLANRKNQNGNQNRNKRGNRGKGSKKNTSRSNVKLSNFSSKNIAPEQEKVIGKTLFITILIVAFLGRVLTTFVLCLKGYQGLDVDMNCFKSWSQMVVDSGLSGFYKSEAFHDYPPGYMYILFILGHIKNALGLDANGAAYNVILKLPAILADLGIAWVIFKEASIRFKERGAAIVAAIFLFNPLIILDSTIWGQTDSVFVFFIVLMIYLIMRDKLIPSYFVFAVGILMKPQSIMFTPIIILAVLDKIILNGNFDVKKFFINLGSGLLAIGSIFLLMLPFDVSLAMKQYTSTLSSYPYATVNAYNVWGLLGKNWAKQTDKMLFLTIQQWGTVFIVLAVILTIFIGLKVKNTRSRYYFAAAFLITFVFNLSARMHERYIFPVVAFIILCYALRPRKEIFYGFFVMTLPAYFNAAFVLKFYDGAHYYDVKKTLNTSAFICSLILGGAILYATYRALDIKNKTIRAAIPIGIMVVYLIYYFSTGRLDKFDGAIIAYSFTQVVSFIYLLSLTYSFYLKPEEEEVEVADYTAQYATSIPKNSDKVAKPLKIARSEKLAKMNKTDYIIMFSIVIIYSVVAFSNIGNKSAPNTEYSLVKEGQVIIDLGDAKAIGKLWNYLGYKDKPKYSVAYAVDETQMKNGQWTEIKNETTPWEAGSVFRWNDLDLNISARYIKIAPTSQTTEDSIHEFVVADKEGKALEVVNKDDYPNLFDEQDLFSGVISYREGTYFDEIYHARTAYEMIHKLYCYENTHPPLGKIFIALGILMFGLNPFGWRFMGVVFGILMLFVMYNFGKKFFKSTEFATIVTLLFAFDFMHYAQTRIATIDVFVVLFIMLAYYFMYIYTQMSFYDTKLSKTFIPLALCGVSMGLSIASKWTGIYSAAGLALIIFIQFGKRFYEYIYASKNPAGTTNDISHKDVIEKFPKLMVKTVLFCVLVFIIVPIIIYLLSYIPFNDGSDRGFIEKVINAQKTMYEYHSKLKATHPYSSKQYQWPTMYRPIWYYSRIIDGKMREGISAFGNPLVWWAGIPAFVFMLYLMIFKKDRRATFLNIGYFAQYAPWFLVTRCTFIYHYFPSVPFLAVMVAYSLNKIEDKNKKLKYAVWAYVALAIVLFIMFYPVLTGTPVSVDYVKKFLKWSDEWVLVNTWESLSP
ncbi:MAG: glycosyltransferase family 39 protein [Lachnospiraceae bacterium]|nr:glycosyltransferase family 39 protein [Lachnospiraceae bacterium]